MLNLRAIFAGLITLSLAALPVGAAELHASMMAGASDTAAHVEMHAGAHTECCPEMDHCEKQTKNECGHSGACAAKCSLIPATTVAPMDIADRAPVSASGESVVDRLESALEHPPFPPPRV